jgi:hypothetical protein
MSALPPESGHYSPNYLELVRRKILAGAEFWNHPSGQSRLTVRFQRVSHALSQVDPQNRAVVRFGILSHTFGGTARRPLHCRHRRAGKLMRGAPDKVHNGLICDAGHIPNGRSRDNLIAETAVQASCKLGPSQNGHARGASIISEFSVQVAISFQKMAYTGQPPIQSDL